MYTTANPILLIEIALKCFIYFISTCRKYPGTVWLNMIVKTGYEYKKIC